MGLVDLFGSMFFDASGRNAAAQIEMNLEDTATAVRVAKATITRTSNDYKDAVTKLYTQRKTVYETTLTNLAKTSEKIVLKKREFDQEKFLQLYKVKIDPVGMEVNYDLREKEFSPLWVLSPIPVGLVKHARLQRKLNESEADLYEAEAEKEEVKAQCAKVRAVIKELKTFYSVIDTLQKLTDKLIDQVNSIIEEKGSDPATYSEDDWSTLMHMFNFGKALSDITKTDIFDKNGRINSWFSRYMKAGKDLLPRKTAKKGNTKKKK